MDDRHRRGAVRWLFLAAAAAGLLAGCDRPIRDTHIYSPYAKMRVVAIAPFVNQSGSADVEPLIVSDLFFSELQMVRGFQVLPLNRSLQAMAALNMPTLNSPAQAVRLAEAVGADMIFVGAITAYDPYDPPELGLAVQVYVVPGRGLDDEPALSGVNLPAAVPAEGFVPRVQVNEVYNARHDIVRKQVREFAENRGGSDSPLGWRLYLKSIQHYVRFASHQAICQIIEMELNRVWMNGPLAEADRQPAQ